MTMMKMVLSSVMLVALGVLSLQQLPLCEAYDNQVLPEGNRTVLAVAANKYGAQVFALGKDGYLYQKYQLRKRGGEQQEQQQQQGVDGGLSGWSNWTMVGTNKSITFDADPACAANVDGRIECFIRGHESLAMWGFHQTDASDPLSWAEPGQLMFHHAFTFPTSVSAVLLDSTGRLNVYLRGFDGQLYMGKQLQPGSSTQYSPMSAQHVLIE
eukprot:TRINITY_DN66257_c1_g1_i2.p1 TRINITY_DN66257_c1_g1~~TRINITY_DN66257_c1_g1_i2.p1  ORF type:complete len:222 (+),score=93.83 TRINITY_DN66257_c1_g1_i2:33-668(+)